MEYYYHKLLLKDYEEAIADCSIIKVLGLRYLRIPRNVRYLHSLIVKQVNDFYVDYDHRSKWINYHTGPTDYMRRGQIIDYENEIEERYKKRYGIDHVKYFHLSHHSVCGDEFDVNIMFDKNGDPIPYSIGLEFARQHERNNYDIVLETVKKYGWALENASLELRDNRNVVIHAIKDNNSYLYMASLRLEKELKYYNKWHKIFKKMIVIKIFIKLYDEVKCRPGNTEYIISHNNYYRNLKDQIKQN